MALSVTRAPTEHRQAERRGPSVPILLVSDDDQVWVRLGAALPGLRLAQHDSIADVIAQWNPVKPGVVLVDCRLEGDLGASLQHLQGNCLGLVPVALIDPQTEAVALALERQKVLYDHLFLTLDAGTALSVLERAGEEAQSRLAAAAAAAAAPRPSVANDGPLSRSGRARSGVGPRVYIGAALAVFIAGFGAYWFAQHTDAPESAAQPAGKSAAPAPASPAAVTGTANVDVEGLLERARVAMRDKRYMDPDDDNALAAYRNVLAIDPANGEARQGLDRVTEVLIARAEGALQTKDYATAVRALEAARSLKPDHPRLPALDGQINQRVQDVTLTQIQAALQADNFDRAAALMKQAEHNGALSAVQLTALRLDVSRRQSAHDVTELVRLASARLTQGKLFEPKDDSAKTYLDKLAGRGGEAAADVTRLRQDYQRRLGAEARAAVGRRAFADANALLAEFKSSGATVAQIASLEKEIQSTQQGVTVDLPRFLQLGQERVAQHRLLSADGDDAVHYYRAALAIDAHAPALPALKSALVSDILEQARLAYSAGRSAEGQALADAAKDLGVTSATLASLAAAAPAAQPAPVTVATQPRLLGTLSPDYPRSALVRRIEGWVDVQFTVLANGHVDGLSVIGAQPPDIFNPAALTAVRRASFEPGRAADGQAVPVPTKVRIRFKAP
jgi:TonB family protein